MLIAEKEVDDDYYYQWNEKFQQALVSNQNREESVARVAEEIETDFDLVGSTAIEDKL